MHILIFWYYNRYREVVYYGTNIRIRFQLAKLSKTLISCMHILYATKPKTSFGVALDLIGDAVNFELAYNRELIRVKVAKGLNYA